MFGTTLGVDGVLNDAFDIDTQNPVVTDISVSDPLITDADEGNLFAAHPCCVQGTVQRGSIPPTHGGSRDRTRNETRRRTCRPGRAKSSSFVERGQAAHARHGRRD